MAESADGRAATRCLPAGAPGRQRGAGDPQGRDGAGRGDRARDPGGRGTRDRPAAPAAGIRRAAPGLQRQGIPLDDHGRQRFDAQQLRRHARGGRGAARDAAPGRRRELGRGARRLHRARRCRQPERRLAQRELWRARRGRGEAAGADRCGTEAAGRVAAYRQARRARGRRGQGRWQRAVRARRQPARDAHGGAGALSALWRHAEGIHGRQGASRRRGAPGTGIERRGGRDRARATGRRAAPPRCSRSNGTRGRSRGWIPRRSRRASAACWPRRAGAWCARTAKSRRRGRWPGR